LASDARLPDFDRPPVVETAIGVDFPPLVGWTVADYGLFWNAIRSEYPETEAQTPLPSQLERFDAEGRHANPMIGLELVRGEPNVRCWYRNDSEGRLIQVQRDRFLHNWRKTGQRQEYPRYPDTRRMFEQSWERFLAFLDTERIARPVAHQCEVTYVNHIERGQGWRTMADLPAVCPLLAGRSSSWFLPDAEVVVLTASYVLPDERGRLHISIQPGIRNSDQVEILQLQLTARGRPKSESTSDVLAWLDMGREWVVRGFVDVTSAAMHERWGRRNAA
jgi:uncharacterized protein (TIGR04255 family)